VNEHPLITDHNVYYCPFCSSGKINRIVNENNNIRFECRICKVAYKVTDVVMFS